MTAEVESLLEAIAQVREEGAAECQELRDAVASVRRQLEATGAQSDKVANRLHDVSMRFTQDVSELRGLRDQGPAEIRNVEQKLEQVSAALTAQVTELWAHEAKVIKELSRLVENVTEDVGGAPRRQDILAGVRQRLVEMSLAFR